MGTVLSYPLPYSHSLSRTTVTVTEPVKVTGITVTGADSAASVANYCTLQMSAAVSPTDATDVSVTWSVTDSGSTGAERRVVRHADVHRRDLEI